MDTLSMLTRCAYEEAWRYLYVLSGQGTPAGIVLAALSGVVTAIGTSLARKVRSRPIAARLLGARLEVVK